MKKLYLALLTLTALSASTMKAQTILEEDFETGVVNDTRNPLTKGEGWTTVDSYSGAKMKYNWYNYYHDPASQGGPTLSGANCAACDGDSSDGTGAREEILLSPELDLNDTYQLQFTWKVSPMNAYDRSRYDLQVRVVENDNLAGAETVFSIQSEQMLRESGVTVFPISTWDPHTSKVDLSDWKGSKVKLAFVYKKMTEDANIAWIDDITVKKFTPAAGPVAQVSMDRYDFGNVYVGEKFYTDVITLTNVGKNGLKITSIDMPQGVSCTLDIEDVDLRTYDNVDFQLAYTAAMTTPAQPNVVLHTTGGDVTISLKATKQLVPEGYQLETFDAYFPPAGWQNRGWSGVATAIEGDRSAYCSGDWSNAYLTSPRLDLTNGGVLKFTYYNQYDGDYAPEYDIEVQVSYNGGQTWIKKWASDYENGLNQLLTAEVNLGTGGNNCLVRWYYPAVESDDEGAYDHSNFTLDRVLLPNVYGADGLPMLATLVSPVDSAKQVYPKNIVLKWGPAQFATGYRVYVGSNDEADNLVDGVDVGNSLTYTITRAEYETDYIWKVVPYNTLGAAQNVEKWHFTTQPDASTANYPYVEDFSSTNLPMGWVAPAPGTYNRNWYVNTYYPYENGDVKSNALTSSYMAYNGEENYVLTSDFKLPEGKSMAISFVWGDEHPRDLVVDPTGLIRKNNVEPNNGVSEGIFSINVDGEWIDLATISENTFDGDRKYWIPETFDLSAYAGKTVSFRWTHKCYNSGGDGGTSIAHVVIEEIQGDKAIFNKKEWMAGKVNYQKAVNSGNIFTLLNKGVNTLKVKSATFGTDNFETSLTAGTEVAPGDGQPFSIQFNAKEAVKVVNDELTVEFESGYKVTFPVQGEALAQDVYYYSFEPNPLDYNWENDFTMIDADNAVSYSFGAWWIHFSKNGEKFAFAVGDDDMETGMYGIMSPVSGTHALVAASPEESTQKTADNWIIFRRVKATANSKFDFYARNWECAESVLPSPAHHVSVLVSTTGRTNTSDFTAVMRDTEMPFLSGHNWNHYEVDLSAYAGQEVFIAVRHTNNAASNVAFFDDFTFSHFEPADPASVDAPKAVPSTARVEVYTINGVQVAKGYGMQTLQSLGKGMYVVKVNNGEQTQTMRVVRK